MSDIKFPDLGDVFAARGRIRPMVRHTPLIPAEDLSQKLGTEVYLKLESLQPTGTFKVRGAANKLLSLTDEDKARGVITFTTGNFGRAVAAIGRDLGISVVICLSARVPQYRVDAMRALGAEVVVHGQSQDEAYPKALEIQKERGLTMIEAFDDPFIISGHGTIALEIMEDLPETAQILVPLSSGSLFSGVALAAKAIRPAVKMVGVSMEVAPAMIRSLEAGRPVEIPEKDSLADALLGGIGLNNQYTFALTRRYIDQAALVTEEEIASGMFQAFDQCRLVVEGSGAVGIAAILANKIQGPGPIVVVVSGGYVSPSVLTDIAVSRYKK